MNSSELRQKFLGFFEEHGHKIAQSSSLLPTDPSVLFTTAGMQQFKPYYLGEKSPWGLNVASVQKCIRTSDIEEVGDERHLTFFEMLGNFSFGGYWKEKAIELAYEFIAKELRLEIDYVTVFSPEKVQEGDWRKGVPEDTESYEIWKKFVPEKKIRKEGVDNFWGPTGEEGPCGPTTEIYVNGIEIWNIVFNEFFCDKSKKLEKLQIQGIDTGMGLERLAMVVQEVPTVFETDLFEPIIDLIPKEFDERKKRIITDHARAIAFLISDGVTPLNKNQGHILRRLMRRIMTYFYIVNADFKVIHDTFAKIVEIYSSIYPELNSNLIIQEFNREEEIFAKVFILASKWLKKFEDYPRDGKTITGAEIFFGSSTFGIPLEFIAEFAKEKNIQIDMKGFEIFEIEMQKHQELSRTASAGMFKGGLADHSSETVKLHTAHHLLLAALQEVFGKEVKQRGSNITKDRLRIDFSFGRKLTDEEKKKVEDMVNEKIKDGLDVVRKEMPLEEAKQIGAQMEFGVKYGNVVSVYFIQDKKGHVLSKEFCGGPHVENTKDLGTFKIMKEEAVSAGVRRIKATLK